MLECGWTIALDAPAQTGRRGRRKRYSDVAIEAGLMLRLAFGRPWRQTESMLGSIMGLLGLDLPVPEPVRPSVAIIRPSRAAVLTCRSRRRYNCVRVLLGKSGRDDCSDTDERARIQDRVVSRGSSHIQVLSPRPS